jgi:hypothetical protein
MEHSVKIFLPNGTIEEFTEGENQVIEIYEIDEPYPCLEIKQGKSIITYNNIPFIWKEKHIDGEVDGRIGFR